MKKLLALFMCLVMCLSLMFAMTACGGEYPEDTASVTDEDAAKLIVGTWAGKITVPEELLDELETETDGMEEYFDFSELSMEVAFTFDAENTVKMTVSEDEIKKLVDDLVDIASDGALEYIKDQFKDTETTWEEYLESIGTTEEELMDALLTELDTESVAAELSKELEETEANYKLEDGKLYISETEEFNEEDAVDFQITEKALYIEIEEIFFKFDKQ